MISTFINLEWKQFFRSSYWQKSIALNILLIFVALYFVAMFLLLGVALFPILKEQFPKTDPFTKVNSFLFYWFLADLIIRFFFQKLPVMQIKPLLTLPIKKRKIVNYVLSKSINSFFNFLPLFAAIPFAITLIIKDYNKGEVFIWTLLIMICTLIINFLNFIIENKSSQTELSYLPIIAIGSSLYALDYFHIVSLSSITANYVQHIIANPVLISIPLGILGLLYFFNFKLLKQQLFIDQGLKSKNEVVQTSDMSWTKKFGDVAPFLQLDLKMIWRNKRPKSTVYLVIIGLLYGLIFYPNPVYKDMPAMFIFVGIFVTGIFMINFGQFIPAWDAAYYKMLMSQNIKYKEYLNSKFTLMTGSAVVLFVLSIPYVYFGWNVLLIHFVALIYNIGVNMHVLLYAGSFNRKRIDLTKKAAFNYQGTGAVQWILGLPLMLLPVLLFYLPYKFINFETGLAVLFLFGIFGIVFHQKIMQFISKKYIDSKYKMVSAFEQTN